MEKQFKVENFDNTHEQDVTTSLRLNEAAQTATLIPMFMLIFAMSPIFMVKYATGFWHGVGVVLLALIAIAFVFASVRAVVAFRVASKFNKKHKQAYKDGQNFIKEQPYVNKLVFNDSSPLVKRLYGKQ